MGDSCPCRAGGGFAVELHETCLDAAAAFAESCGFTDVRIVDDGWTARMLQRASQMLWPKAKRASRLSKCETAFVRTSYHGSAFFMGRNANECIVKENVQVSSSHLDVSLRGLLQRSDSASRGQGFWRFVWRRSWRLSTAWRSVFRRYSLTLTPFFSRTCTLSCRFRLRIFSTPKISATNPIAAHAI